MPKRTDIKKILVIGSGPIVIGQACEFDYSGTQACRALRKEGFEVVLVNSNPATIMTDPETADRTYVEPITVESVTRVIERERPDALLPNMGGQTALNCTISLGEAGVLDKYNIEVIGCNLESIRTGEDRELFSEAVQDIGLRTSLTLWKMPSVLLLSWDTLWSSAQALPLVAQVAVLLTPQKSL